MDQIMQILNSCFKVCHWCTSFGYFGHGEKMPRWSMAENRKIKKSHQILRCNMFTLDFAQYLLTYLVSIGQNAHVVSWLFFVVTVVQRQCALIHAG
jgi:hypothetical protein